MIHEYLLIDGHDRLAAALCEDVAPDFVAIEAVREVENPKDESVQEVVMKHLAERGNELSVEKRNEILLSHFDDRPVLQNAMKTTARFDPDKKWEKEVTERLTELNQLEDIEVLIK